MSRESGYPEQPNYVVEFDEVITQVQLDRLVQLAVTSTVVSQTFAYPGIGVDRHPERGGGLAVWTRGLSWIVRGPLRGVRRELFGP